jgi:hypothetical protein
MTTRHGIHSTLLIRGVGFQYHTHGDEEHQQNSGMYRFSQFKKATPKDEYPMAIANMLTNNAYRHRIICFLDGNAGYNQIFMAEENMSKTTFRCLGFIGLFEWVVMTFGLKNARATYQRVVNLIFHDLLGIV